MDYKEMLISSGYFRSVDGSSEYRCNCPYCGERKQHMYLKIDIRSGDPVVYHCFKCGVKGILNDKMLNMMGMENIQLPTNVNHFKRLDIEETVSDKMVMTCDEHDDIHRIQQYIFERVGYYPTLSQLQEFQFVGNPFMYTKTYLGYDERINLKQRNWFRLTNGNIIGRTDNDNTEMRWLRYKSSRIKSAGIYSIKNGFDICKPITVCISEGIMDSIGLYYQNISNNSVVFVSVLGKNYQRGIEYILSKGIFGKSVNICIFKDPDVKPNSIYIDKNLKRLFNKVELYENVKGYDYGVKPELIEIKKIINWR